MSGITWNIMLYLSEYKANEWENNDKIFNDIH